MRNYFNAVYGLVTDNDPTTENGQLFLALYMTLLHKEDSLDNDYSLEIQRCHWLMQSQLMNSFAGERGLFHRNPDLIDRRIMSHDNMIGIMCWSSFMNTHHRTDIWNYIVRHFGLYDNTKGRTKQFSKYLPFSPQSLFVFALAADSWLAYLFLPFYILNLIVGCNKKKEDTSGKILDFITMYSLSDKWIIRLLNKYYERKMKKQYGDNYVKEIINIYFGNSNSKDFPINKLYGLGL